MQPRAVTWLATPLGIGIIISVVQFFVLLIQSSHLHRSSYYYFMFQVSFVIHEVLSAVHPESAGDLIFSRVERGL